LIGYAIGLPGQVVSGLFMRSFYALKNAVIPLFLNIFAFMTRIGLILLFSMFALFGKGVAGKDTMWYQTGE
jgi:peptidoglycan biosynthesis protein MviN/MurJ (putative lipid II flippase)